MEHRTVAVIGLGLIGGSVARELAAHGVRVLGYDRDPDTAVAAQREGVLAGVLTPDLGGMAAAEAVVLAAPVAATPGLLAAAARQAPRARLITDVGSTKASAIAAADALGIGPRFVGSHPLAGDHRSGWSASRRGLFREARVFLCPAAQTAAETVGLAERFWSRLGARTELVSAAEHDRRLAWGSHLPQLASTALALALREHGVGRSALGPGGRDATRLAGSDPDMWTDIAVDNAASLGSALDALQLQLEAVRERVRAHDAAGLRALFHTARNWFQDEQI